MMKNTTAGFLLLFVFLNCFILNGAPILQKADEVKLSDHISLEVRNMDIQKVFTMISKYSDVNIVMHKSVRGKITLKIKDVYFEKAIELVSFMSNLGYRKIKNTYVIGPRKEMEDVFDAGRYRLIRLQFASAPEVAGIIRGVFKTPTNRALVSVDRYNNAVLVSGSLNTVEKVGDLIRKIDVPIHQVRLCFKMKLKKAGEKEVILFNNDFLTRSGVSSRVKSGNNHQRKNGKTQLESGYRFTVDCSINANGLIAIKTDGEFSYTDSAEKGPVKIYKEIISNVTVKNSKQVVLGKYYEHSIDSTFTLTVTPEIIK